jgi:hypothetical protein
VDREQQGDEGGERVEEQEQQLEEQELPTGLSPGAEVGVGENALVEGGPGPETEMQKKQQSQQQQQQQPDQLLPDAGQEDRTGIASAAAGSFSHVRPWPAKKQGQSQQKASPFATKLATGAFVLGKQSAGFSFASAGATRGAATTDPEASSMAKSPSAPQVFSLPPATSSALSSSPSASFNFGAASSSNTALPSVPASSGGLATPFRGPVVSAVTEEGQGDTPILQPSTSVGAKVMS